MTIHLYRLSFNIFIPVFSSIFNYTEKKKQLKKKSVKKKQQIDEIKMMLLVAYSSISGSIHPKVISSRAFVPAETAHHSILSIICEACQLN